MTTVNRTALITIRGIDALSAPFTKAALSLQSAVSNMTASSAGSMAALSASGVALGIAFAQMASQAVGALKSVSAEALRSVSDFERYKLSSQSLIASQILQAGVLGDMKSVYAAAAGPAEDLLKWEQKLAILSPFVLSGVVDMMQLMQSSGFSVEDAKKYTQDMADWGAATGKTSDIMERLALNSSQVLALGKLTGREIRDFSTAGLPVLRILADAFHKTTAEIQTMVSSGAMPAKEALEANS